MAFSGHNQQAFRERAGAARLRGDYSLSLTLAPGVSRRNATRDLMRLGSSLCRSLRLFPTTFQR